MLFLRSQPEFPNILRIVHTLNLSAQSAELSVEILVSARIKGRGYCDVGTSVISEFYTPLVPKGHDFLQTIGSLAQARQDGTATCEAKGDGTD